jgi:hypothetical protein
VTRPLDWLRAVARDPKVKETQAVALQLVARAKGSGPHVGTLFISQPDLMEATGLKKRRVHDLIHELINHGYLEMIRKGTRAGDGTTRASEYRLTTPSTCIELHVEDASQPALVGPAETASTGNGLHLEEKSQRAIGQVSTCTEGPPKREEHPREKNIPPTPQSSHRLNRSLRKGAGQRSLTSTRTSWRRPSPCSSGRAHSWGTTSPRTLRV